MKRLLLIGLLLGLPYTAHAGLDCSAYTKDWRCVQQAHNQWARDIALANGNFAKGVTKLLARFAKDYETMGPTKANEVLDVRYDKLSDRYRENIRKATYKYYVDKLGYHHSFADEIVLDTFVKGQYEISNKLTQVWVNQIQWL